MTDIYSAMQVGKPYKSYRKTILGKVYVTILDPFTQETPIGIHLEGEPTTDERAIVDIWSEKEDVFFKRMNKRHFETGNLIPYIREEKEAKRTVENSTDEELKALINKPFLSLQAVLNKTNSEALVFRILTLAKELEKSDKIIKAIESRLSEIQFGSETK